MPSGGRGSHMSRTPKECDSGTMLKGSRRRRLRLVSCVREAVTTFLFSFSAYLQQVNGPSLHLVFDSHSSHYNESLIMLLFVLFLEHQSEASELIGWRHL